MGILLDLATVSLIVCFSLSENFGNLGSCFSGELRSPDQLDNDQTTGDECCRVLLLLPD